MAQILVFSEQCRTQKKNENKIQVDLADNYEITVKEFNEKYGNSKPVEKQLIRIE